LTAALVLSALAAPALGAVKDPRAIEVFFNRDLVLAYGYPPATALKVDVLRGPADVVVGTTTQTTDAAGVLEINHVGGGDCWDPPATPDIIPGDTVRVTVLDGAGQPTADVDSTATRDLFVDLDATEFDAVNNTITVHGHARSLANAPISPGDALELRLNKVNRTNTWSHVTPARRDLRVDVAADLQDDGSWTHVFTGLTNEDVVDARDQGIDQIHEWSPAVVEGDVIPEITVYDGSEGIPPGCPPHRSYAVTGSAPAVVNRATQGQDLTLSGVAYDTSAVRVTLDDADPATPAVVADALPTPAEGGQQTWSTIVPAAAVAGLSDGTLTASGSYTDAATGSELGGGTLQIVKDTVAPGAPTATPPGGTYSTTQAVALEGEPGTTIRYTQNGSVPTAASTRYTQQIMITASQTLRAIALDAAGNASGVATHAYTIATATVPGAPTIGAATAGDKSATVSWTRPASTGGSAITGYTVTAVRTFNGDRTSVAAPAGATSATVTGLINGVNYRLEVTATNAVGTGPTSALSNQVKPAAAATATVPGAPTIGAASSGSTTDTAVSATARWSSPSSTGGSAITAYQVTAIRSSDGARTTKTVGASRRSLKFTGLVRGATYRFEVRAVNAVGAGAASGLSNQVTAR